MKPPLPGVWARAVQGLPGLCGAAAPVVFGAHVLALASRRSDYDHVRQLMSDLATPGAPYGAVMSIGGFVLPGVMTILFAMGLERGVRRTRGSRIGPLLVALGGLGMVGAGAFPGQPDAALRTVPDFIHALAGIAVLGSAVLGPLALAPRFRADRRWRGFSLYSAAVAAVVAVAVLLFFLAPLRPWQGVVERGMALALLLWMVGVGTRLSWLSTQGSE